MHTTLQKTFQFLKLQADQRLRYLDECGDPGPEAFDRPKAASGNLGVAWQHKRKQTRTMCSDSVGNLSRRHLV